MRNAILYTKTPLEMDKCLEQIKIMYKGARGNEYQIHLGKPQNVYMYGFHQLI